MKLFFIILFYITFNSCTPEDTGKIDSSPIVLSDADRIKNLETKVSSLEKQLSALSIKFTKDSAKQWLILNTVSPLIIDYNKFKVRFEKDSARQWVYINSATALIPKVSDLTNRYKSDSSKQWKEIKLITPIKRFTSDSVKQWVEINKLKATSPVIQIPIMQADIKSIKTKNVSQDKNIIANESSIKVLQDTIILLKVVLGSDFGLDASSRLKISQAGMNRIKVETQPQP